ncbi:uncharacterized protein [Coffea arabica]|uniref:Uncharacterized protein isoform X2 n=1 Tax=Coffea arabica TaxID=13443 RepID=A0ABM4VYF3_COFAR
MEDNTQEKEKEMVEIHMYFGGIFRSEPNTAYVGDYKLAIWKDRDPSELSIVGLCRMFKLIEKDATRVTFWWCVPDLDMETGLLPIAGNDDIKLMNDAHLHLPIRVIYSVSGDQAFEEPPEHCDGASMLQKEGANASHACEETTDRADSEHADKVDKPDWLDEGLESIEEEDIFAVKPSEKEAAKPKLHVFALKGDLKSPKKLAARDQPTIEERERLAKYYSACSHLQDSGKQKQQQGLEDFEGLNSVVGLDHNWNEPVIPDEELLERTGSDGENVEEYLDFDPEVEFKKPVFELKIGHKFKNFRLFRLALLEWNIREGYETKWVRNDSYRITAVCERGCSWRIHASKVQGTSTFQIKTLKGEHCCGREYNNKHVTARYLGQRYQFKIRDDPKCNLIGFQNEVKRDLMVNVTPSKLYRAKRKAREDIQGLDMEQYHNLWHYAATILKYNPGSTVKIQVDKPDTASTGTFERMYFCLHACKQGFLEGCRPIIGLDGCFLKSAFGGQLLSALGRDGNDNMIPIALAAVEVERYDSWRWFLHLLLDDLGLGMDNTPWTFISDRQKGLVQALRELFPDSEHRFCVRHMYQNFSKKFKGKELKDMFWACASTGNEADWHLAMKDMEKVDSQASAWLSKFPPTMWARSHFSGRSKCDILVNNLNESFNNYILPARELAVVGMFEWIRRRLMQRFQIKRTGMEKFQGKICPNIHEKIENNVRLSRTCVAIWANGWIYEVDCGINKTLVVDLQDWTCTCGLFQLTGYPCVHACAAIQARKRPIIDFVHKCYSKEAYVKTYRHVIMPVPSARYWEKANEEPINPPLIRKMPGRPKKVRRRAPDEPKKGQISTRKGLTVHCKKCFKPGHNSRSCKNSIHPNSKFNKANQEPAGESSEPYGTSPSAGHTSEPAPQEKPVDNPNPSKSNVPKRRAYTQPTISSVNRVITRTFAAS